MITGMDSHLVFAKYMDLARYKMKKFEKIREVDGQEEVKTNNRPNMKI